MEEDENDNKRNTQIENDDHINEEEKTGEEKDAEIQKKLNELEKEREEYEEKKKEAIERLEKERESQKRSKKPEQEIQKTFGGQIIPIRNKKYIHKFKVFRHNKLNDLAGKGTTKIQKALKKVHGISLRKKMDFLRTIKAYNLTKSTLKKKDFEKFVKSFKSKRFNDPNFKKVAKEGINIKELRKEFGKRDIDKLRRGITGVEDPYKYKSRRSDFKRNSSPLSSTVKGRH